MIRERVDAGVYSPVTLPDLRLLGGIVLDEGLVPCDGGSVLVDARDLVNDVVVPMLAFAASAFAALTSYL